MRTFRLIGMALLAVCVTFASCSSNDNKKLTKNDDGIITNQKQLKQMKQSTHEGSSTMDFTYDSKGRLTSVIKTEEGDGKIERSIRNYIWGNNVIMAEGKYNTETFILDNNLVRRNDYNEKYIYNSSNQPIAYQRIRSTYTLVVTYTWDNGKITKIVYTQTYGDHSNESVREFIYSGKTCKGYFPLYCRYDYMDNNISVAHPELIGMHCSQLPDQEYGKGDDSEFTGEFSYTFDKDGYVESCTKVNTIKHLSDNTTETYFYIYTFTWE